MSLWALAFTNLRELFAFGFVAQNMFYLTRWYFRQKASKNKES